MRYIGSGFGAGDVQIDADTNSFINVRSFGAIGFDGYFTGVVSDLRSNGSILDISEIPNFYSNLEFFKEGNEIEVFFTSSSNSPGSAFNNFISNAQTKLVGSGIDASNYASAEKVTYYIYGYDPFTGKFSPYQVSTTSTFKFLKDPDLLFDDKSYVQLLFSRKSSQIIPLIFRKWGSEPIKFLGAPGNSIFGSDTSVVFNDRGLSQVPSWDRETLQSTNTIPSFLQGILSYSTSSINATTILEKRTLKITNVYVNSGTIELKDISATPQVFSTDLVGSSVRFVFNSTTALKKALDAAAKGPIKEIFIPSGTYHMGNVSLYDTDDASYYSGITLRGAGDSTVIRRTPSHVNAVGNYGLLDIRGRTVDDAIGMITVKNLAFDGNKFSVFTTVSPTGDFYGISDKNNDTIYIERADSVRIENCSFYNGAGSALTAIESSRLNITNNRVYELSKPYELNISPLRLREVSRAVVQGNLFENTTGPISGIGIEGSVINNNIVNSCGQTGILLNSSESWSAQNNLAYNENGSVIKSVDLYNNEYSRVSIDVKKGIPLTTTYFTVTDGGLPMTISKGSINAPIYSLNSNYQRGGAAVGYFQVLETNEQLEAGIFAITLPTTTVTESQDVETSNRGRKIIGTSTLNLLNPNAASPSYGYSYVITASVAIGKFQIDRIKFETSNTLRVTFRNSADILSINYLSTGGNLNDGIQTAGIGESKTLQNWPDGVPITVQAVNLEDGSIIINTPQGVSDKFTSADNSYRIVGGTLGVVKFNYFIADGNVYVSE